MVLGFLYSGNVYAGIDDIGSGVICDDVRYGYQDAYSNEKKEKKYSNTAFGSFAQLVEHFPFKKGAIGSNPIRLTKIYEQNIQLL